MSAGDIHQDILLRPIVIIQVFPGIVMDGRSTPSLNLSASGIWSVQVIIATVAPVALGNIPTLKSIVLPERLLSGY
mgnify:FL=1